MNLALLAGMNDITFPLWMVAMFWLLAAAGWVGHAVILTAALNYLYGCPLPKPFLKLYRLATGAGILAYPLLYVGDTGVGGLVVCYTMITVAVGGGVFPLVTLTRSHRPRPPQLVAEVTETVDYWPRLGRAAIGDGKWRWVPRLPGNQVFQVDFTRITLAFPDLPPAWDGAELLVLSDLHFHGTPARCFFDAVIDRLGAEPPADLVLFAGDTVDSDAHLSWIQPVLGRLTARDGKYAVVGNHDAHHRPDLIRAELAAAGYDVVGNGWKTVSLRGEPLTLIGHEGPWFGPPPDVSNAPPGFRLLLSHSPDNFPWAAARGVQLTVSGHVHGGQIRLPVIGSIFVPSVYGRRFDDGVFADGGSVLVVCRGLSGKEPLRMNCRPQVVRVVLRRG